MNPKGIAGASRRNVNVSGRYTATDDKSAKTRKCQEFNENNNDPESARDPSIMGTYDISLPNIQAGSITKMHNKIMDSKEPKPLGCNTMGVILQFILGPSKL